MLLGNHGRVKSLYGCKGRVIKKTKKVREQKLKEVKGIGESEGQSARRREEREAAREVEESCHCFILFSGKSALQDDGFDLRGSVPEMNALYIFQPFQNLSLEFKNANSVCDVSLSLERFYQRRGEHQVCKRRGCM